MGKYDYNLEVGLASLQKQNVQQMRKRSQITTFNSKLKNRAQEGSRSAIENQEHP